jgi:predicted RNA binding protein YcfA (HicA-like mRNA interferase family)
LLNALRFAERIKGSHHIFTRRDVEEIINIQPKGNKAKAYQVKQIRNVILKYRLGVSDE